VAELVSSAECVHCSWSVLGEEAQWGRCGGPCHYCGQQDWTQPQTRHRPGTGLSQQTDRHTVSDGHFSLRYIWLQFRTS